MTPFQFYDKAPMGKVSLTPEGYMQTSAKVARTGIQVYDRKELGLEGPGEVRLYRPEEEVFNADSMASYAHRPVTVGHPSVLVTADNWKEHASGYTGDQVVRDKEFVKVPFIITDGALKSMVMDQGVRELSMGYTSLVDFVDGVTPEGEPYDAIQRDLRMNHLAIVPRARGGSELRIGDNKRKDTTMVDPTKTRTVVVDGLPIEVTDAAVAAIEKKQGEIQALTVKLADAGKAHDTAMAVKDAQIADLQTKVLSDAALDARVEARVKLLTDAKVLVPTLVVAGKSDADVKRMVVASKFGDAAVTGKSDDYVSARFDILIEDAAKNGTDPVRAALLDGGKAVQVSGALPVQDTAFYKNLSDAADAWKKPIGGVN